MQLRVFEQLSHFHLLPKIVLEKERVFSPPVFPRFELAGQKCTNLGPGKLVRAALVPDRADQAHVLARYLDGTSLGLNTQCRSEHLAVRNGHFHQSCRNIQG